MSQEVLLLALGSNFFFALGSQFFAYYSRTIGANWMNWYKAFVAQVCFVLALVFTEGLRLIPMSQSFPLMLSGLVGLGAGDVFLLMAFKEMGPGRTFMLFAFQPLVIGTSAFLLFGQAIDTTRFWAIFFFILCILIFSLESFKRERHWGMKGILLALLGMIFDAAGVLITRKMFDSDASLSPLMTNFYRTNGALIYFFLFSLVKKDLFLFKPLKALSSKGIFYVSLGSLFGTFISLSLFLKAMQTAHLASLSAVAITGTIFSALFECLWHKKLPSIYLVVAFISFMMGMKVLVL
ncbi:MAG: DMT family transporter [Halobacteriovoraceae bacterium]|nr:DMT family transporter [Halobacteriovoraceae bacterium]